jgi:Asp-tRNA(Asn)/Glu-tRNA(Gln) amidotransferase A subunit family amidase
MTTEPTGSINPKATSFAAAVPAFRDGTDSPRAFLERCIVNIDTHDQDVGAFVAVNIEAARDAADQSTRRWQSGEPLSLIDGMPVGIKDIMETADMPTEQGSPLFAGWRGGRDCAAVAALREAGAVVVGKTVTTEFAATQPRGTRNPWDLSRTPGGSSSGSAAGVAAGMVSGALGTQVIGSILRPASYCGCFGFKPGVGGINRGGSFDAFSQSCSGTLAASLEEGWIMARAITTRIGGDPGHVGLSGPLGAPEAVKPRHVAFLETAGWQVASGEARAALTAAREKLAAQGIEIADRNSDKTIAAAEEAIAKSMSISRDINAWEGHWPLNTYARDMDRAQLSKHALARLTQAEGLSQEQYRELIGERQRIRDVYAVLSGKFDVCISLSATGPAPVGLTSTGDAVFVVPSSLLGVPALSLPVLEAEGLPLGLQVLGFDGEDAALFAAAAAILSIL